MAAEEKIEFELVSPEALVVSKPVDMVVVPGAEGDFGAMHRHSLLISAVRPGTIRIFEGGEITDRIFVAGGFAEVNGERCTVLAEEAMSFSDMDRAKIEQELETLRRDHGDSEDEQAKKEFARRILVREEMLEALATAG